MKLVIKDISTDPGLVDYRVFTETGEMIENVTSIEMGREAGQYTHFQMGWFMACPLTKRKPCPSPSAATALPPTSPSSSPPSGTTTRR